MSRGTRLEQEDAEACVGGSETASNDACSRAACHKRMSIILAEGRTMGRLEAEDGSPPAMTMSYSSLITVGVDIEGFR